MKLFNGFKRNRHVSCEEVLEVLQSYLDGETDADTALSVSGHLDECQQCEPESAVYRRIKSTLNMTAGDVDPTVLSRLENFGQRIANGQIVASTDRDG